MKILFGFEDKNEGEIIFDGQILGIVGVEGNGQNELAECIFGFHKGVEGKIMFEGKTLLDETIMGIRESGRFLNYYSDRIGAQMRTAIHGMVAPGDAKLAAKLAVLDSVVSHSNNGIIGGMFNAVLVSLAFVEQDMRVVVKQTISCLPKDSEYYAMACFALDCCETSANWEEAW